MTPPRRITSLSATAWALILICLLGGGLRAYKVVEPNAVPGDDALAYFALAKSLAEDGSFGGPDFNNASDWSPGAPLVYAAAFKLTGEAREGLIRILQALIGIASILVAFALARRLAEALTGPPVDRATGRAPTFSSNSTVSRSASVVAGLSA